MKGTLLSSEIAEPYAQALISVAQSHDLIDRFGEDVAALGQLLENSPELNDFLMNPVIKESAKKEVLRQVMGSEAHPYLFNFLMLLVDKRRIFFLDRVCQQFLNLIRQLKNTVLAELTSATELSEEQQQAIVEKVKFLTGASSVELKTRVDPDLIGGVVIKVGSQVFDTSLRGQLRRIGLSLNKGL